LKSRKNYRKPKFQYKNQNVGEAMAVPAPEHSK